jgi:Raf kinase inhibitor-like YbhB/YbcL family protein
MSTLIPGYLAADAGYRPYRQLPSYSGILLVAGCCMWGLSCVVMAFAVISPLKITSPDFRDGGYIPMRFTCDGEDINPTLLIEGWPPETRSLVLIVEDPDAALTTFTQWLVWNIPPTHRIEENTIPGIEGLNTVGKNPYRGPCPAVGPQRYAFKVYALDRLLSLNENSKRSDVEKAIEGHIVAAGMLTGVYDRTVAAGAADAKR